MTREVVRARLLETVVSDGPSYLERVVARALVVCDGLANHPALPPSTRAGLEAARGYFLDGTADRAALFAAFEHVDPAAASHAAETAVIHALHAGARAVQPVSWRWSEQHAEVVALADAAITGAAEILGLSDASVEVLMDGAVDEIVPRPPAWRRGEPVTRFVEALEDDPELLDGYLEPAAAHGTDIDGFLATPIGQVLAYSALEAMGVPRDALIATLAERVAPYVPATGETRRLFVILRDALAGVVPREVAIAEQGRGEWTPHAFTNGPLRAVVALCKALDGTSRLQPDELHGWLAHQRGTFPPTAEYHAARHEEGRTTWALVSARHPLPDAIALPAMERANRAWFQRDLRWDPRSFAWGFTLWTLGGDDDARAMRDDGHGLGWWWEKQTEPVCLIALVRRLLGARERAELYARVLRRLARVDERAEHVLGLAAMGLTPVDAHSLAVGLLSSRDEPSAATFAAAQIVLDAGDWVAPVSDAFDAVEDRQPRIVKAIRKELPAKALEAAWARFRGSP